MLNLLNAKLIKVIKHKYLPYSPLTNKGTDVSAHSRFLATPYPW